MSADLEEVVMSVLFLCCNVCCRWVYVCVLQGLGVMSVLFVYYRVWW